MQRVRIGLTGLASVFLLVLLAAVFSRASDEEPITANAIDGVANVGAHVGASTDAAGEKDEPLAELGVAPGSEPESGNVTTSQTITVEDPLRPQKRR